MMCSNPKSSDGRKRPRCSVFTETGRCRKRSICSPRGLVIQMCQAHALTDPCLISLAKRFYGIRPE